MATDIFGIESTPSRLQYQRELEFANSQIRAYEALFKIHTRVEDKYNILPMEGLTLDGLDVLTEFYQKHLEEIDRLDSIIREQALSNEYDRHVHEKAISVSEKEVTGLRKQVKTLRILLFSIGILQTIQIIILSLK